MLKADNHFTLVKTIVEGTLLSPWFGLDIT